MSAGIVEDALLHRLMARLRRFLVPITRGPMIWLESCGGYLNRLVLKGSIKKNMAWSNYQPLNVLALSGSVLVSVICLSIYVARAYGGTIGIS